MIWYACFGLLIASLAGCAETRSLDEQEHRALPEVLDQVIQYALDQGDPYSGDDIILTAISKVLAMDLSLAEPLVCAARKWHATNDSGDDDNRLEYDDHQRQRTEHWTTRIGQSNMLWTEDRIIVPGKTEETLKLGVPVSLTDGSILIYAEVCWERSANSWLYQLDLGKEGWTIVARAQGFWTTSE